MRFFSLSLAAGRLRPGALILGLGALSLATQAVVAQRSSGYMAPRIARHGVSLGPESPSAVITGTVWLNMHNKAAFDAAVKQLYAFGSPTYHKWMTPEELKAFEPTAAEVASVKAELTAHHLTVVSADPSNLGVRFKGQASDVEAAFQTHLGLYKVGAETVRVTSSEPKLGGAAAGLVRGITGVNSVTAKFAHAKPLGASVSRPVSAGSAAKPLVTGASPDGEVYSSQCLFPPSTVKLDTPGIATATYTGMTYGANPSNTAPGTVGTCAYGPEDLWKIYGLKNVYAKGYEGQGQTVVIVDAYGSPTIAEDAGTFSKVHGLPALTSSNFQIYTISPFTGDPSGWDVETTIDVESAHSIAPKANIALVEAASPSFDDFNNAVLFAINNKLGNVISNSYGAPEGLIDTSTLITQDEINEVGASQGISVDFSSGDDGDFSVYYLENYGVQATDVDAPADSPYATAVGGTSVALLPNGEVLQTGWGNNITQLSGGAYQVEDPPLLDGFGGGAGGGMSSFFALPSYQSALPGPGRELPDVSALADPQTGLEIVISVDGGQYYQVWGGTSLACPIFSAIWALVNQYYDSPLGNAAPYAAAYPGLLVDVLPPATNEYNTAGSVTDWQGTTKYSAEDLAAPLENTTQFLGALLNNGGGYFYDITFGTDTSLTITPGWDNVTGFGTPYFGYF